MQIQRYPEGSEYWMSSPVRIAQQTRRYFIEDDKSCLKNQDWQGRNRVYVGPMYIILTVLRVHLRIVEKEDKERTKGRKKGRCVTSEKRSGYWNREIYRNWESEAASDRRNALVTSNMQGRLSASWFLLDSFLPGDFYLRFSLSFSIYIYVLFFYFYILY